MAFCNIQIGGSVFQQQETRSKNFTASKRDNRAPLLSAADWREAHENMYDDVIAFIEACRGETRTLDALKIHDEQKAVAAR